MWQREVAAKGSCSRHFSPALVSHTNAANPIPVLPVMTNADEGWLLTDHEDAWEPECSSKDATGPVAGPATNSGKGLICLLALSLVFAASPVTEEVRPVQVAVAEMPMVTTSAASTSITMTFNVTDADDSVLEWLAEEVAVPPGQEEDEEADREVGLYQMLTSAFSAWGGPPSGRGGHRHEQAPAAGYLYENMWCPPSCGVEDSVFIEQTRTGSLYWRPNGGKDDGWEMLEDAAKRGTFVLAGEGSQVRLLYNEAGLPRAAVKGSSTFWVLQNL